MKAVSFRGLSLQTGPYRTSDSGDLYNSPQREIMSKELARSDNAVKVYRRYKSGNKTIAGTIRGDTETALEQSIDALKLQLLNQEGELSYGWAGGTRHFNAECLNVNIARGATDLTRAAWSAQFYLDMAFATDGQTLNLFTAGTVSLGSQSFAVNNAGTYLAIPYITLTLTAYEPNLTESTITVGNPASSEYLDITGIFKDGDIITIDCLNKQVFRNAELMKPVGLYPAWAPGPGLIDFSDTGSSRTIPSTGTYQPRYL